MEELQRLKNLLKQKNQEIEICQQEKQQLEKIKGKYEREMKKNLKKSQKNNSKMNKNKGKENNLGKTMKSKFNRKEWLSKRLNRRNRLYKKKTLKNNLNIDLKKEIFSHLPAGKSSLFVHSLPEFDINTRTEIYKEDRFKRTYEDKELLFYDWWDNVLQNTDGIPAFDLNKQLNIFTEQKSSMKDETFLNIYRTTQQDLFFEFTNHLEEFGGIPNPHMLIDMDLEAIRDLQFYEETFNKYYFNEQKKTMEKQNKIKYTDENMKKTIMIDLLETNYSELGDYLSNKSENWSENLYEEFNDLYKNRYTYQNLTSLIQQYHDKSAILQDAFEMESELFDPLNALPDSDKIYILLYHWLSTGFFDPYPNIEFTEKNFSILMQRFMFMTNFTESRGDILSPYFIYILNSFLNRLNSSNDDEKNIVKSEIFNELLFLVFPENREPWNLYIESIDNKFMEEETKDVIEGNNLEIDKDITYWTNIWKVSQLNVYDFDFKELPIKYKYQGIRSRGSERIIAGSSAAAIRKEFLVNKAKRMYQHEYGYNYDNVDDPLYELFQKIYEFEVNQSNYFTFINLFAELPHYLLCAVGM